MTAISISLCKFAACAALLTRNFGLSRRWPDPTLRIGGLALAMSASVVIATSTSGLLLLGLLVWQIALNVMSARFQADVVSADPVNAGAWITGAILLGSATGYVLRGAAMAVGPTGPFRSSSSFPVFCLPFGSGLREGHAVRSGVRSPMGARTSRSFAP